MTRREASQDQAEVFHTSLILIPLLLSIMLGACSSTAYIPPTNNQLPPQHILDVPFFAQTKNHCGPAALAGLFNFYGIRTTPNEIAKQVYLPGKKGSLQLEMIAAIRQAELLPYNLSPRSLSQPSKATNDNFTRLLTEVAAGRPVLILQNLGFEWWTQWHYAIVVGYALDSRELILHSGTIKNYRISMDTFINTWNRADNWAVLPLPPSQLPETAEARYFIKAAADLESTGHKNAALIAYNTALQRWPDEPLALMGLGNISYAKKKYERAVNAFTHLTEVQTDNVAGWNNLAYALHAYGCQKQSAHAIKQALQLSNDSTRVKASQKELLEKTIGDTVDADYCQLVHPKKLN